MRNILKSAWIVLIIAAIGFASCQKKKEDKISDTWRLLRVSIDSTVTWYELWQMDDGYITMLKRNDTTTTLDTLGTGQYAVDAGMSKTFITMESMSDDVNFYNGKWEVLKLNNDIMVILHEEGGWYYREFVKE